MSQFYGNRPFSLVATQPRKVAQLATATRDLSAGGTTSLLSDSGGGRLLGVWLEVAGTPAGTPAALLRINVDGDGAVDVLTLWDGTTNDWTAAALRVATVGDGDTAGDKIFLPIVIEYSSSIAIDLVCGSAGSGGSLLGAALYSQNL